MQNKWKTTSLEELGVQLIDCDHKTPKAVEDGVPYIGIPQMDNGRINFEAKPRLISEEDFKTWTRKADPKFGDVILSRRCTSGETVYVPKNAKFALGQNLVLLRPTGERLHPEYLRWAVQGTEWWDEVNKYLNPGAIFESLKCRDIPKFKIPEPPKWQQIKICEQLSAISDKIELNRQTNQTLESMAQTLFKSWFVDFDPVFDNLLAKADFKIENLESTLPEGLVKTAKIRLLALNGLAEADKTKASLKALAQGSTPLSPTILMQHATTHAHFPSEFEHNEQLGWIPKGWESQPFGDLLENTIGGDWGKELPDEKHTIKSCIVRGTDIPPLKNGSKSKAPVRWVEEKKFKTREIKFADIIIEVSGGSPTQPTGRSVFMSEGIIKRLGGIIEPASFCRKFRPLNEKIGLLASVHLQKIYDEGKTWEYQNQSTGISNFQTKHFLEKEIVLIPKEEVLSKFYDIVINFINRKDLEQSERLTKLRDTLLPKLISGELQIPDVITSNEKTA